MNVKKEYTGIMNGNTEIMRYILTNDNGIVVEVISQGASITKIITPDRYGNFENIVLSYPRVIDYIKNRDCFGAVVGRTAGRISNAKFIIDGKKYELYPNENNNLLHGGESAFHLKNWDSELIESADGVGVRLYYISPDGEGGYPAEVRTEVVYFLNNDNVLDMKISATSSVKTVYDATNHSYFNLNQYKEKDILEHYLKIDGTHFVPLKADGCPMGLIAGVDGTSFDFRKNIKIINAINIDETQIKRRKGIDHPILINKQEEPQIQLYSEVTGRKLSIWTNRRAAVVYTANHLQYKGIAFEVQDVPDAINHRGLDFELLSPDNPYFSHTKYYLDMCK